MNLHNIKMCNGKKSSETPHTTRITDPDHIAKTTRHQNAQQFDQALECPISRSKFEIIAYNRFKTLT
jgi:hypothetical protein